MLKLFRVLLRSISANGATENLGFGELNQAVAAGVSADVRDRWTCEPGGTGVESIKAMKDIALFWCKPL